MAMKIVPPELGAKSFTCPHCGATSHQSWYHLFIKTHDKDSPPRFPNPEIIDLIKADTALPKEGKAKLVDFFTKILARELFLERHEDSSYLSVEVENLRASICYSCDKISVWLANSLLYPLNPQGVAPHDDMPDDVRHDFLEAAAIVDKSSRGAAALLRLCVQKLMKVLGESGDNINDDIKSLVAKGLDPRIQKMLDVVRVIGNNAVHPGQIDLTDDKATASKLFDLVNLIVEAMISTPKHIEAMYGELPPKAVAAIEKRDGKSEPPDKDEP